MSTTTQQSRVEIAADIETFMSHCNGCDRIFRHWLGFNYTSGVKYVAEKAGAYWLIDAVGSYQRERKVRTNSRLQEFQLWELAVDLEARSCVLTLREDSDEPPVVSQSIEFTDFPLPYFKLYLENGLLLLPDER